MRQIITNKDLPDKFSITGGFTYTELQDEAKKLGVSVRDLAYVGRDHENYSLVEKCKDYLEIENLHGEIISRIGDKRSYHSLGYCHLYWGVKHSILKEKYNMDWASPAELNTDILYD